jgi:hypothetical protein
MNQLRFSEDVGKDDKINLLHDTRDFTSSHPNLHVILGKHPP